MFWNRCKPFTDPKLSREGYKQVATLIDRSILRDRIGCKAKDILLLSVGELNANKNHVGVIRALETMNCRDIHYVIAGRGELMERYKRLIAKLGMQDNIHLLGYCNDVDRWYKAADIFVFPSFRLSVKDCPYHSWRQWQVDCPALSVEFAEIQI